MSLLVATEGIKIGREEQDSSPFEWVFLGHNIKIPHLSGGPTYPGSAKWSKGNTLWIAMREFCCIFI